MDPGGSFGVDEDEDDDDVLLPTLPGGQRQGGHLSLGCPLSLLLTGFVCVLFTPGPS